MARPLRIQYPGAFYHVTSRGNEQKIIFKSRRDREKFCEYLGTASSRYGAVVHCYCLMDNHYHLLLETPEGNLSQIMRHINGAYTTYFNVKRKRAGHLFQGRYKAILVEADEYALELSRYIHLNPVRAGMVERPEGYEWSSFGHYINPKVAQDWLNRELIWGLLGGQPAKRGAKYKAFVELALDRSEESPFREVIGSSLLGSSAFVSKITARFVDKESDARNLPDLKSLVPLPTIEDIRAAVEKRFREDRAQHRQIGLYCCRQYSRKSLAQIGKAYGISDAGVSAASQRVAARLETDVLLREVLREIEGELDLLKVET